MHWQKLSDLGVLIWNVQVSTCHHVPSNAMCMIHDDLVLIHYGSIDPVWIHYWPTPDPLFILGSHHWSQHSSISGSEVPTHFLQEPLDCSILGTDVRHQHHLRLRLFWWFSNDNMFSETAQVPCHSCAMSEESTLTEGPLEGFALELLSKLVTIFDSWTQIIFLHMPIFEEPRGHNETKTFSETKV